jgi:hypothetical protein
VSGDRIGCVIGHLRCAMQQAFTGGSDNPPLGGGSEDVRLFAGDAIPLAAWDAHAEGCGCNVPFLWIRLARRYRSTSFPTPTVAPNPCGAPVVVALEVGVGRCAIVDPEPSWEQYEDEALVSFDDSWRIELALCQASSLIAADPDCATNTATDLVVPFGPEGGVIAWLGTLYVQL